MVSHLVMLYCSPCSASCSLLPVTVPFSPSLFPPPHHCPLLPITVPSSPSLSLLPVTVPSFPSPSPPSHHCPFLPITVPSSPPLSPLPHHCPLLPITSCYHGRWFFPHYSQGIPSFPQSGQLKRTPLEC